MSENQNHVYRVLLVEEDPKQTELYSDLLREVSSCQVDVVSRIESSLDWMDRASYHLIVLDLSGGKVDGLDLLERIKRLSPMTSVILISDQATVEQAVAAIRLGAEDYFQKPFNLESFRLAVKRGLDRKAVFGNNAGASGYLNLLNSCQMISATLEQSKILGIIQSYFARELSVDHASFYHLSGQDPARLADAPGDHKKDRAMEEVLDIALHASGVLPKMTEGDELYRFVERGQLTPGLFIFRFRCAGARDCFYVALSPEIPSPLDAFESRLKILKTQIELTGKNIDQYQGVQSLVYVDDVTGLYNTRYLHHILDREIAQYQNSNRSFAVLFIDADHFKKVNDTHGHLVGSKLLNELGLQLRKFVRGSDTVFRYGGDEFVAVLSPCDLATAQTVAERIRSSVEKTAFLGDEGLGIHFTVSIGVAIFPDHAQSKKAIIDAADQAMYSAKRATRNSVFIAQLEPGREAAPAGEVPKAMPARVEKPSRKKRREHG